MKSCEPELWALENGAKASRQDYWVSRSWVRLLLSAREKKSNKNESCVDCNNLKGMGGGANHGLIELALS